MLIAFKSRRAFPFLLCPRQTDRQTNRDRHTARQTDRQTDRQAGRQGDRDADREAHANRQPSIKKCEHTKNKHTDKQTKQRQCPQPMRQRHVRANCDSSHIVLLWLAAIWRRDTFVQRYRPDSLQLQV